MLVSKAVDLASGARLSHFTLERPVGAGGMGQVWAARDARSGQSVALKVLVAREATVPGARQRFLREARATQAIKHPAIVPVTEVVEDAEVLLLVMELLEGETLRALLARRECLELAEVAWQLLPIADALGAAHAAGIVHRDLKPENIFLQTSADSVTPRLLDFGIARFYEPIDGGPTPITALGTLLGTLPYMAPEQALSPSECDQGVDAWALGVILYEALSGCRPVEGNTAPETMRQLLLGGITPLGVVTVDLPTDVLELVTALLSRDRQQRATTQAAATLLARYAAAPRSAAAP